MSLKYKIRDFAIKYSQKLTIIRAKIAESFESKLAWVVEEGDLLRIDQANGDLEWEASKCYQRYVVRSRLNSFQQSHEKLCIYT